MRFSRNIIAFAATILAVEAQINGFNSGSTKTDGSVKVQSDFEAEFRAMQNLPNATCFNAVRLFTSIQGGTPNTPISAINAAINTNTKILLGLWASAGEAIVQNEIQAVLSAVDQYKSSFTDLVVGISVGSEDLYRDSSIAVQQGNTLPGVGPTVLVNYIGQVRKALANTALSSKGIGHVDTWTSWVNGTDSPVIGAVDWIGVDAYPYFENTLDNPVDNGKSLLSSALSKVNAVASGKPVWITETGWPTSGKTENKAVPSVANAKTYWDDVFCTVSGTMNIFWYILDDAGSSPSFGIVPSIGSAPYFDLTCPAGSSGAKTCGSGKATSSASASATASSSVASATAPGTTAATEIASVVQTPASGYVSGTAVPVNPSSSAATVAPYPVSSGAAGSAAPSGYAPSGTGAAGASGSAGSGSGFGAGASTTSSGSSASATPSSYTGAADKVGAAAGAGFLALLGLAAAL
ncbi:hypothetical protein B0A48_12535 [Cryoendolithus antarcticus]|uniref:Probable glucan endo-1,3-beta-glucosidase eglC n=1 Tax=Cryoendolithus antarcticus TaxID=1507870 RepID=A0A1V8SSS0_9PEZI|nr:hypothetical protein B0A48_12535 [Cryoendolithus antarcticus]